MNKEVNIGEIIKRKLKEKDLTMAWLARQAHCDESNLCKILKNYDPYRAKYLFNQTEKIDVTNDIIFENNGVPWITGLKDDSENLPSNWIRAGSYNVGPWVYEPNAQVKGHFNQERLEDFFFPSSLISEPKGGRDPEERAFKDYSGKFGTLCGGTWAPYILSSPYDQGPQAKYTVKETVPPNEKEDDILYGPTALGLNNYFNYKLIDDYSSQPGYNQTMTNLYSVNVVITPDKSKWTRCIVLEACTNRAFSEGGALRHEPRKAKSVDKDGKPVISKDNPRDGFGPNKDEGMGWFPGYAINLETGERLNMMFSENSDETLNNDELGHLVNGRDMIFNPTSTYAVFKEDFDYGNFVIPAGTPVSKLTYDAYYKGSGNDAYTVENTYHLERIWGGMHYVYVCNSAGNTAPAPYILRTAPTIPSDILLPSKRNFNLRDTVFDLDLGTVINHRILKWGGNEGYLDAQKKYPYYDCGPYDSCHWFVQKFNQVQSYPEKADDETDKKNMLYRKHTKMQLFNNVMYTHIPMLPEDPALQKQWMSCDVTYKIRVTRPYLRYISRWYESPELRNVDYTVPDEYAKYKGYPVYKLSTRGLEPTFNDTRLYQSILDNINIVPNPYYGASMYERNVIENIVKITNLPTDLKNGAPVTISIYTVSGILVRTLTKGDSATSYVNWDLKNYANIPVASGVYIIHVNCPGIGERMLKFFCTMRQTDLNTF
jgi:hypothetical protein